MAVILHIETSTDLCSAALAVDGCVVAERICTESMSHATRLPVFVDELLKIAHERQNSIDAVAVSAGPGSYTGLRIGVSTAKGLCYGLNAKLLAINTLQLIACEAAAQVAPESLICPMIDARRMEVYCATYTSELKTIAAPQAVIVDTESFAEILTEKTVYFCGNGAEKCQNVITHPNAHFLNDCKPLARNMAKIAETLYCENRFEDVAYFEPFYLKEFQPTHSKSSN